MHPAVYALAYWVVACGVSYVLFARKGFDSDDAVFFGLLWGPGIFLAVIFSPIWVPVLALDQVKKIRARRARELREVDKWMDGAA